MTLTVPVFILSSSYGEYEIIFAPNSVFFPEERCLQGTALSKSAITSLKDAATPQQRTKRQKVSQSVSWA